MASFEVAGLVVNPARPLLFARRSGGRRFGQGTNPSGWVMTWVRQKSSQRLVRELENASCYGLAVETLTPWRRMERTSGVWSSARSSDALHLAVYSGHFVIVAGTSVPVDEMRSCSPKTVREVRGTIQTAVSCRLAGQRPDNAARSNAMDAPWQRREGLNARMLKICHCTDDGM